MTFGGAPVYEPTTGEHVSSATASPAPYEIDFDTALNVVRACTQSRINTGVGGIESLPHSGAATGASPRADLRGFLEIFFCARVERIDDRGDPRGEGGN
jgi:hypothetical protein